MRTWGRSSSALSSGGFYGWHVAAMSAVALAATAPGQTAAVSAFVDPMIADLDVTRSQLSFAYLVGTLVGAVLLPTVGRLLDRFGPRRTMAVVGAVFGAVLVAFALVTDIVGVTVGFVGIRLAGQGALGLVATTATALWFVRRRGAVLGAVAAVGAVGISLTPLVLERVIATYGWRTTWVLEGVAVWLVVLPIALFGLRDRPADLGQVPDGRRTPETVDHVEWGLTRSAALRTPFFWVLATGVAASGMLCTAVAFHQISLLGDRGVGPAEAAANFIPQTVAALAATLAVGVLVDRVAPRWLASGSMVLLAVGLLWAVSVRPGWSALGFGLAIGAAGGAIRSLEMTAIPRYYGTLHVGSIRGLVAAVSVGSTAFGPLLFALGRDATGGYGEVLSGSAVLPAVLAVGFLFVAPPPPGGEPPTEAPMADAVEGVLPPEALQVVFREPDPRPRES